MPQSGRQKQRRRILESGGTDGQTVLQQFLLLIFLVGVNAFFAASEVALISLKPAAVRRLAEKGRRGRRLAALLKDSGRYLATVQVGVTFAGFLASAFAADAFAEPLTRRLVDAGIGVNYGTLENIVIVCITVILSYISLVFGELLPKQLALRYAEPLSLRIAGVINLTARVAAPFVWLLNSSVKMLLRLTGSESGRKEEVTEEEIRIMVDIGEKNGAIETDERKFIENIFEFNDTTAAEVMTPRTGIAAVPADAPPEEIEKIFLSSGFSRLPVYRDSIDNIVGQLNFREYFTARMTGGAAPVLENLINPVYLAPETMRANLLFRNMQSRKSGMAVILDEFGGTSGIVTMEDLLEEIVGSIYDELDRGGDEAEVLGENQWRIDGSLRLDELSEKLGIPAVFPEETACYDTVSGLIFGMKNEVPVPGMTVTLPEAGLTFTVESVEERRAKDIKVAFRPPPPEDPAV